ncbi:hypothetical protein ACOMHN_009745 [Nucella lapillus]
MPNQGCEDDNKSNNNDNSNTNSNNSSKNSSNKKSNNISMAGRGPPKWRSSRFCLAYMVSTGLMVVFYHRVSFSMAVVCMVNHTALDIQHQHQQQQQQQQQQQRYLSSFDFNRSLSNGNVAGQTTDLPPSSAAQRNDTSMTVTTTMTSRDDQPPCQRSTADDDDRKDEVISLWLSV